MSTGIAWCMGKIVMRGEWGDDETRDRNGQTCGGLGLSLAACVAEGWVVTHMASGHKLGVPQSRRHAKEVMKRLLELSIDWLANRAGVCKQVEDAKLAPEIRRLIANPYLAPLRKKRKAVKR